MRSRSTSTGASGSPALDRGRCRLHPLRQLPAAIDDLEGPSALVRTLRPPGLAPSAQRLRYAWSTRSCLASCRPGYGGYYWVLDQAEIATDVMFTSRRELSPRLARPRPSRHPQLVLRRRARLSWAASSTPPWRPRCHRRQAPTAGLAGPPSHGRNWVKVYDKASVLRVETTINNPREFRALRVKQTPKGRRERRWCPMRKGVGDLWRNFQVGIAANRRYLDALAAAPLKGEGVAALDALCRPRTRAGVPTPGSTRSPRPTWRCSEPPWPVSTPSTASATRPDQRLYRRPALDRDEAHRRCERVSRLIVKLRGHGLVAKVPRARLYRVTPYGLRVLTAAIRAPRSGLSGQIPCGCVANNHYLSLARRKSWALILYRRADQPRRLG